MGIFRKWRRAIFLLKWVVIPVLILLIVSIFVAYMAGGELLEVYDSLTLRSTDSKINYDKKLYYVTVNEDGSKTITIGFQSEAEYEAAQQKFGDYYDDGDPNDSNVVNPSEVINYNISGDGQALVELIKNYPNGLELNSHFASYVDQYGYVYDELIKVGIPADYALGIVANLSSEGTAGMRQSTYEMITKSELEILASRASTNRSNSVGIGLMQWTYWTYIPELLNKYNNANAWNADGTLNVNKALEVETAWIIERALGSVSTAEGIANGDSTRYAEYWCDYHEKPAGWCAGSPKMRYCYGQENPGTACTTRTERLKYLLEGMSD